MSLHDTLARCTHTALFALQDISVRPPPGSLRRGWIVAPRVLSSVLITLALLALVGGALRDRLRRRR